MHSTRSSSRANCSPVDSCRPQESHAKQARWKTRSRARRTQSEELIPRQHFAHLAPKVLWRGEKKGKSFHYNTVTLFFPWLWSHRGHSSGLIMRSTTTHYEAEIGGHSRGSMTRATSHHVTTRGEQKNGSPMMDREIETRTRGEPSRAVVGLLRQEVSTGKEVVAGR